MNDRVVETGGKEEADQAENVVINSWIEKEEGCTVYSTPSLDPDRGRKKAGERRKERDRET